MKPLLLLRNAEKQILGTRGNRVLKLVLVWPVCDDAVRLGWQVAN